MSSGGQAPVLNVLLSSSTKTWYLSSIYLFIHLFRDQLIFRYNYHLFKVSVVLYINVHQTYILMLPCYNKVLPSSSMEEE